MVVEFVDSSFRNVDLIVATSAIGSWLECDMTVHTITPRKGFTVSEFTLHTA